MFVDVYCATCHLTSRKWVCATHRSPPLTARQCGSLTRQLEEEKGRVNQVKRDMEAFKMKAKAGQERAARMVGLHVSLLSVLAAKHAFTGEAK